MISTHRAPIFFINRPTRAFCFILMFEDTNDVLFDKQPIFYSCNICGKTDDLNMFDTQCALFKPMSEQHICHQCAYWLDIIQHPPLNMEVIGGVAYIANPFVHRPLQVIKGHFGKEFYIRKYDETLLRVNNLWNLGKIPERFREQLPDTANFLSLMTYQKLSKDPHKCYAKGCWDRYHCLRYNLQLEKDGPFNTVPDSHRVGSEECPSFINFNELRT